MSYRATDYGSLYARNLLLCDFYTEVATSHHHAVSRVKYLVDIVHAVLVLDFSDYLDWAVVLVEQLLYLEHVLLRPYERVRDEVHVVLHSQLDEVSVLVGERWQIDSHAWHVHALAAAKLAVVQHLAYQALLVLLYHLEVYLAVVEENVVAQRKVLHNVLVRHCHALLVGQHVWVADYLHPVAGDHLYWLARLGLCGSYLRTLGVNQDSQFVGHGARVLYHSHESLVVDVRGIGSHYVNSGLVEAAYELDVATKVRYCRYYFCVLAHLLLIYYCLYCQFV